MELQDLGGGAIQQNKCRKVIQMSWKISILYSDSVIFFSAVCNENKWRTIQDVFKVAADNPEKFVSFYRYFLTMSQVRTILEEMIGLIEQFEFDLNELIRAINN